MQTKNRTIIVTKIHKHRKWQNYRQRSKRSFK